MLVLGHDRFFGETRFARSLDGVTLSHRVANSPPDEVVRHTHSDAHFVLITSGEYVSSARASSGGAARLIFNPPGTTHRDHFRHGVGSFFTMSFADDKLSLADANQLQRFAVRLENGRAPGIAVALLTECVRWDSGSRLIAEALCCELLLAAALRPVTPAERTRPAWLRTAADLIQDCPADNLTIAQIAKAVDVHPTHLARSFRKFLGCTPGDLLRARRLEMAAGFLLQSAMSIADIALDCGFSDQSQFTKAFSRGYGIAPAAFRRLRRGRAARRNVAF